MGPSQETTDSMDRRWNWDTLVCHGFHELVRIPSWRQMYEYPSRSTARRDVRPSIEHLDLLAYLSCLAHARVVIAWSGAMPIDKIQCCID